MADILGTAQSYIPNIAVYGSGFVSVVAWIILIVLFIGIAFGIGYFIVKRKQYKYKIVLWEELGGRLVDTGKDVAMAVKFGDLGSKLIFCKKFKKYVPFPTKESGFHKYYFKNRPDGLWENFEVEDVHGKNPEMQEEKEKFIEMTKSMLYQNTGIRKGLKERYEKVSLWQQYGTVIISFAFVALVGVLAWLIFDKFLAIANVTNDGIKAVPQVLEKLNEVLAKTDNICGAKGYITP